MNTNNNKLRKDTMMKRRTLTLALLMGFVLFIAACDGKKREKNRDKDDIEATTDDDDEDQDRYMAQLRKGAKEANATCPVSLGIMGEMVSMTMEDDVLVMRYDINEDLISVATMADDRQTMRDNAKVMLSNPTGAMRTLMELVIKAGAKMKVSFHGKESDAVASITLSADELEELLNNDVTPEEKLETAIASTKLQLPIHVAQGMDVVDLKQEGNNVIYVYVVDETMYSVDLFEQNKAQMKEAVMAELSAQGTVEKQFVQIVVNAGANLVYRYKGDNSGAFADVTISNRELKNML